VILEHDAWLTGPGLGDALVLCGALSAALYTIVAQRVDEDADALTVTAHQFAVATSGILPLAGLSWTTGHEAFPADVAARFWVVAVLVGMGPEEEGTLPLSLIQGRNVAVLGYGSQGHAHALSLRDSGVDVRVGLLEGSKSRSKAEAEGLRVVSPFEACEEADLVVVLAPDPAQRRLYAESIEPNLVDGDAMFFGHGFNIRYGYIVPPPGVDVCTVAPKGPGHLVRRDKQ